MFKIEEPTSGTDLHAMSFHARGKRQENAQGHTHCACVQGKDGRAKVREERKVHMEGKDRGPTMKDS